MNKAEYNIRADFFAGIPAASFSGVMRQKPRNAARMSETTISRLILSIVYELCGLKTVKGGNLLKILIAQ